MSLAAGVIMLIGGLLLATPAVARWNLRFNEKHPTWIINRFDPKTVEGTRKLGLVFAVIGIALIATAVI